MADKKPPCEVCGDGENVQVADTFYEDTFACRACGLLYGTGRFKKDDDEDDDTCQETT